MKINRRTTSVPRCSRRPRTGSLPIVRTCRRQAQVTAITDIRRLWDNIIIILSGRRRRCNGARAWEDEQQQQQQQRPPPPPTVSQGQKRYFRTPPTWPYCVAETANYYSRRFPLGTRNVVIKHLRFFFFFNSYLPLPRRSRFIVRVRSIIYLLCNDYCNDTRRGKELSIFISIAYRTTRVFSHARARRTSALFRSNDLFSSGYGDATLYSSTRLFFIFRFFFFAVV